jgi:hypothetical protein
VLLVITNRDDLTADFLIVRLLEMGLPYFRLNSEDLGNAGYLFRSEDREAPARRCAIAGKSVDLNSIRSVWYRRMIWPSVSEAIVDEQRRFAAGELRHLVEGLVLDPSILWVNSIDATAVAERKVFQLRLAKASGFEIPPTVISNDPAVLRDFAGRHGGEVVCKPFYHGLVSQGAERYGV